MEAVRAQRWLDHSGDFPLANLTVLAQKLHDALAPAGMFIYTVSDRVEWLVAAYLARARMGSACLLTAAVCCAWSQNECFRMGFRCHTDADCATQGSGAGPATCRDKTCHAAVWPYIPAGLDHISLDVYNHGAKEAKLAQSYAEKFFFPLLKAHQSVWLVPGMFGRNGTKSNASAMAAEDDELLEKLEGFWEFASSEPRVTGMIPWVSAAALFRFSPKDKEAAVHSIGAIWVRASARRP